MVMIYFNSKKFGNIVPILSERGRKTLHIANNEFKD